MAVSRYLPRTLLGVPECQLFFVPGLKSTMDAFSVAGLMVTRLEYFEWNALEDANLCLDLDGKMGSGNAPFWCVFTEACGATTLDDPALKLLTDLRAKQVQRLVRAMRLIREGMLYDPKEFQVYTQTTQGNIRSSEGWAGRAPYYLSDKDDAYELHLADLGLVDELVFSLSIFDSDRRSSARGIGSMSVAASIPVVFAEACFSSSYSLYINSAAARALMLTSALEALAGRDLSLLSHVKWGDPSLQSFVESVAELRDCIAHGDTSVSLVETQMLRALVRQLLCEAISIRLEDPGRTKVVGEGLLRSMGKRELLGAARLAGVRCARPGFFDIDDYLLKRYGEEGEMVMYREVDGQGMIEETRGAKKNREKREKKKKPEDQ